MTVFGPAPAGTKTPASTLRSMPLPLFEPTSKVTAFFRALGARFAPADTAGRDEFQNGFLVVEVAGKK